MSKNRRFPFERSIEKVFLENFATSEEQLYPVIRQYASVCRVNPREKPRHPPSDVILFPENDQLPHLMNHLKEQTDHDHMVDQNNTSALREHNVQHWKHVKRLWQNYYRDRLANQQLVIDNLIKTPRN